MQRPDDAAGILANEFAGWLDGTLSRRMPADVKAFNFNLYAGETTWDVDLVGAAVYDPADSDWACDAISLSPELFFMPQAIVGDQWEQGLAVAIELITTYLRGGNRRDVLRSVVAVGVGFVDGDLTIVWPPSTA